MSNSNQIKYTAVEKIAIRKPVDRLEFLSDCCKGELVLDLGALDETAYLSKVNSGRWLHRRLSEVAEYVLGVDNSVLIPETGLRTSSKSVIVLGDIFNIHQVLKDRGLYKPSVVVAGELIEHLENPQEFLRSLKSFGAKKIMLSTPNACNIHNGIIGMISRESMHKDHVNIFSFKTLTTVISRAGFSKFELVPYHAEFSEMIMGSKGVTRLGLIFFQRLVRFLENRFPILSGGLIAVIDLT